MAEENDARALEHQVADLKAMRDRYRAAMQDTLEQVDWCVGYFEAHDQHGIASMLGANRSHIRTHLLGRAEEPLPGQPRRGDR